MFSHRSSKFSRLLVLSIVTLLFASAHLAPAQDAVCTLADHIRSANTKTAVGFCPAGTSHDIITIAADITLTEPLPPITSAITIEGGGHTISGDGKFRIFDVQGGNLTIKNLTLADGYAEMNWSGPTSAGALTAYNGAEIFVNHSVFIRNRSDQSGGAIAVNDSKLTVNNSSFLRNRARYGGGAINLWHSTGDIRNSSFVENSANQYERGGAILVSIGVKLDVSNSSFQGNSADRGGAVASQVKTHDGRIIPSTTTLTHVTIMKNYVKTAGSGISIGAFDKNFNLRNSIVAGLPLIADSIAKYCEGPLNENIGNLIADGSCASMAGGDPMLGEMTGAPAYFPLLDGSPALDSADARFCSATDQLGTARPQGGGCDIGAIESTTAIPVPTLVSGICPLPDQIIAANTDTAVGSCAAGNGADTIYLIRDFTLEAKLPPITSDITLEGNGYTISGENAFGIFEVDGGSLTISDVTLTEGNASRGGAISLKNGGVANVADVTFRENSAFFGGAIATESAGDRLTVRSSNFEGNFAETSGGAIMIDGGVGEVGESAFGENYARQYGGALATSSGRLSVFNSTLHGNRAEKGGGIYINGGDTRLTHLTLMNNTAGRVIGAGIYREAGAVYLRNSIVAGSGSGDDCFGNIAEKRGNFSQDGRCAMKVGGDPMLAELVKSPAHYPLADDSPAHGRADPAFCPATDQLGNPRTHCDIGAIESARDPNYKPALQAVPPAGCTLADQIIAANTDAPSGSCPAGNGADTIHISSSLTLAASLPPITSDLTIDGNGHTISGNSRFRLFDIESGKMTIKHATLIRGTNPEGYGGAIALQNSANLTVVNVTFRDNGARFGGAISSTDDSRLLVFDSRFFDNVAEEQGGAVWSAGYCGDSDNSVFRRNRAGSPTPDLAGRTNVTTHFDGNSQPCLGRSSNSFSDS
ncbi:MAG: hypothetical protein OXG23_13935 [Chloroflexi bacterium]|nr:hypothetical protein [Chloroflexota bacterium]